jgi:hypothetical protein
MTATTYLLPLSTATAPWVGLRYNLWSEPSHANTRGLVWPMTTSGRARSFTKTVLPIPCWLRQTCTSPASRGTTATVDSAPVAALSELGLREPVVFDSESEVGGAP